MVADSQCSHSTEWRTLVRAAIFETNDNEIAMRISAAEEAVVHRMHELYHGTGIDVEGEREALDDALYALRAWKIALENKPRAA